MGSLIERKKKIMMMQTQGLLPPGYQRVEYLKNTNYTAGYVETDIIIGNNPYSIDAEIYTDVLPETSKDFFIHGVKSSSYYCVAPYRDTSRNTLTFFPNGVNTKINFTLNTYHRLTYSVDPNTRNIIGNLDETDFSITVGSYTTDANAPFMLFAKNTTGNWHFTGRYIRHKMTVGNEEYDLLPCIRISDSQPGFYDVVHKKFYAGNSYIAAGPTI